MFFIFGWNKQTVKQFGPTLPVECPNCHNDTWWHLLRTRTWFTLFFIPVIPYSNKHLMLCEICQQGVELNGDQANRAKELSIHAQQFANDEITDTEFGNHIDRIDIFGDRMGSPTEM